MDVKRNISASYDEKEKTLHLKITGEIDHHSAKIIREEADEMIFGQRPSLLLLDFSDIEFMDSSGLGLIMGRYKLMRIYGGVTKILNPSHRVLRIIELAGINRIIDVEYNEKKDAQDERSITNEDN